MHGQKQGQSCCFVSLVIVVTPSVDTMKEQAVKFTDHVNVAHRSYIPRNLHDLQTETQLAPPAKKMMTSL